MEIAKQISKNLRDVHFGGNWTWSTLKEHLSDITWQQATTKVHSFNTIATLVFHINYFVQATLDVLQGKPLTANDKFSFDYPPINSTEDWEAMLSKVWDDAEQCASLIEQLPDSKLSEIFVQEKYGTYYRNLTGTIEHAHYHLGQIVIIKKLLLEAGK
jgi:uncharacterized damage-inducible protein DinB